MAMQAQQQREKTWLEKLDEFLVDEFHHGLYRLIGETWPDVMVGENSGDFKMISLGILVTSRTMENL